jgi:hypothetical protein
MVMVLAFWLTWRLSPTEFYVNFSANFLANLLVGAGIVTAIAWWMNKRERNEQKIQLQAAKAEKTIRYLAILKSEIENLLSRLPQMRSDFSETGWGRVISIDTPFWDVVERSGELPGLTQPDLLSQLTLFYNHLAQARQAHNWLVGSWMVPNPNSVPGMASKTQAFIEITERRIDSALEMGNELVEAIDQEVNILRQRYDDRSFS